MFVTMCRVSRKTYVEPGKYPYVYCSDLLVEPNTLKNKSVFNVFESWKSQGSGRARRATPTHEKTAMSIRIYAMYMFVVLFSWVVVLCVCVNVLYLFVDTRPCCMRATR